MAASVGYTSKIFITESDMCTLAGNSNNLVTGYSEFDFE